MSSASVISCTACNYFYIIKKSYLFSSGTSEAIRFSQTRSADTHQTPGCPQAMTILTGKGYIRLSAKSLDCLALEYLCIFMMSPYCILPVLLLCIINILDIILSCTQALQLYILSFHLFLPLCFYRRDPFADPFRDPFRGPPGPPVIECEIFLVNAKLRLVKQTIIQIEDLIQFMALPLKQASIFHVTCQCSITFSTN